MSTETEATMSNEEFFGIRLFPFKKIEALCTYYYFAGLLDGKQSKAAELKAVKLESELREIDIKTARTIYENYESIYDNTFLEYNHFTKGVLNGLVSKFELICEGSEEEKVLTELKQLL